MLSATLPRPDDMTAIVPDGVTRSVNALSGNLFSVSDINRLDYQIPANLFSEVMQSCHRIAAHGRDDGRADQALAVCVAGRSSAGLWPRTSTINAPMIAHAARNIKLA
jgi:hypothetical protein